MAVTQPAHLRFDGKGRPQAAISASSALPAREDATAPSSGSLLLLFSVSPCLCGGFGASAETSLQCAALWGRLQPARGFSLASQEARACL